MKNKTYKLKRFIKAYFLSLLGTLRSNDADGNQKVKKGIGFISKKTNLHVHHAFLYISLPVFGRLRREKAQFRVLWST